MSALFFGGEAEEVLRHIVNNHHMILSDYIVDEFVNFAAQTTPKTAPRTVRLMRQALNRFIEPYDFREVDIRDVNDIDVMQLAIQYNATIITGDKDILEHAMGAKPPVITLGDYRELFF